MSKQPATKISETEEELFDRAQEAVSTCNWVVGECAAKWTQKYAKGRTDADFGHAVGMSGDQVYQRRRVWETFADVYQSYPKLKWSHFYVALTWDDAPECFQWAVDNDATVAEMKAWRRLQHGEDLTVEAEPEGSLVSYMPTDTTLVREPVAEGRSDRPTSESPTASKPGRSADDARSTVSAVARESEGRGGDYAPFRQGAGSPAPKEQTGAAVAERPKPSVQQIAKRMTTTVERCNAVMTPDFIKQFRKLPEEPRQHFLKAADQFMAKVAKLKQASGE